MTFGKSRVVSQESPNVAAIFCAATVEDVKFNVISGFREPSDVIAGGPPLDELCTKDSILGADMPITGRWSSNRCSWIFAMIDGNSSGGSNGSTVLNAFVSTLSPKIPPVPLIVMFWPDCIAL